MIGGELFPETKGTMLTWQRIGNTEMTNGDRQKTIKDVSRLWQYINGGMPQD
jgi:hypothetical protein